MRSAFFSIALAIPLAIGGCAASVEPEAPVGYTQVTYAPIPVADSTIESYPHTWYENRPVYLVNGRWWYRDGSRWAYYTREPDHLRHTRRYVQEAPPAGPPASAPPAIRVR
jgi:hypothetical protein